ncbi:MAG TPA: acetylornithine transaminase [Methylomirabilota bacterium]|jgi:acetylornithine/N-succinyldiaminopimelate aminotransferase|nr:acetylornithine transaminase [Methylomirabilota bacterium]
MNNDLREIMKVADRPTLVMVEGKGSWLWDRDGKKYLDFVQGWAVNCLGHSPAVILDAINDQARRLINCSPAYYNEPMAKLATLLAESTGLDEVFLCNSGAEANEGAIKLARKWGSRHRGGAFEIVTMEHGFHGRTLATMAASGKPGWDTLFQPKVPGFPKVPLGDLEAVRKAVTPETVAVMLEPIQGEAGVFVAADDWLRDLRKLTRDLGILLILDEIQTGIGRTGRMYGYEHAGIEPDIVTLGKGLGGGTPIAALVASAGASVFEYGDQGGTFNGNALMAAVGCAVVTAVGAPGFLDSVVTSGRYLTEGLGALSAELGHGEVRGRGLLVALQLQGRDAAKIARAALDRGLLINAPRPDTLRFMPSLTVSREEIDEMLERLRGSLEAAT